MVDVWRWSCWSALSILFLASACSLDGSSEDDLAGLEPLCDGSDDVRLVYSWNGGLDTFYDWNDSRFSPFFYAVDGHCNYWVRGGGSLQGIHVGSLDVADANELGARMHFGRFFTVADYRSPVVCLDGGASLLSDGTATLQLDPCHGEDDSAPAVWLEAASENDRLSFQLDRVSEPIAGPVSLLALRQPQPSEYRFAEEWSSALDLDARAIEEQRIDGTIDFDVDAFTVLVEDEPTLSLIAALRRSALAAAPNATDLYVKDSRARVFRVLVHDEPPEKVRAAVRALDVAN